MLKNFIQQTTECLPGTGNASYQLTIEEYFLSQDEEGEEEEQNEI